MLTLARSLTLSMMTRTDHYAVSLCPPTAGPNYTHLSGGRSTTVDNCLINCWAAHLVSSCEVLTKHGLNLSDHLPIHIVLYYSSDHLLPYTQSIPKLNWRKAVKDGSVTLAVFYRFLHFTASKYSSVHH